METEPKTTLLSLQNEILEAIATGVPFARAADILCRRVEEMVPDALCSILLVENGRLQPLAGPSLPKHMTAAIQGSPIGPTAGSCGTAAFRRAEVAVVDIEADPLWADYKQLALPVGIFACWSTPIFGKDGGVIATFAFYYRARRSPTAFERSIVRTCAQLCGIGIEHERVQARHHRLAFFDQLTDLPNRRSFDRTIAERLSLADPSFGLLLVDIDHLKAINDTMGHVVGDRFINEVANRLAQVELAQAAFRLSGDEFAVFIDPCPDHQWLQVAAAAILSRMKAPFECDGSMIVPQVTIGGVVSGEDGDDAGVLRQNADFALYHAKATRRGGYVPFRHDLRTALTHRITSIRSVDSALREGRTVMHYQPLVRLDSGEIIGTEALVRLRDAEGAILAAGEFQAAFTDPNIAHRLTRRMLTQVAQDVRRWLDAGIPMQRVGINVSPVDFMRGDLGSSIRSAFGALDVPLRHIVLEVTEAVFMDGTSADVLRAIKELREQGMLIALDDFGTGFASLTHLLTFPVDVLKIDRSFVDRLLTDRPSAAIVESMIDIGRKLDMRIVAEGIECEAQAQRLRDLGCQLGQGYHYARPADATTTTRLLAAFAQRQPVDHLPRQSHPVPLRA